MRTILYTACDAKYEPLAKLTVPLMIDWAMSHDTHWTLCQSMPGAQDGIYWAKFHAGLNLLQGGYDRIIWLDADQLITNPEFKFDIPQFGFHVSTDWGFDATAPWHFSVCGFVAHKDCIPLFEEVLKMEPESRGKPFPEQQPCRDVVRRRIEGVPGHGAGRRLRWDVGINIHPPKFLNAVPNEVCPGKVVDPWKPGDFAAHLTMLDVPKRIELFHEIKKQAGI